NTAPESTPGASTLRPARPAARAAGRRTSGRGLTPSPDADPLAARVAPDDLDPGARSPRRRARNRLPARASSSPSRWAAAARGEIRLPADAGRVRGEGYRRG